MPADKPIILNQEENNKRFADEQTDKRNHEHLMNEKDEISADDIKNVRTDVVPNDDNPNPPGTKEEDENDVSDKLIGDDQELQKVKDGTDPEIDNASWNVLGS